ncbi:hypothetical protein T459_03958 [Capsicum annuum]|uniref:Plastocyanin-like domain-containing protein n=1 Tax=Capsicum annuum TaxID=4072 RepID=A0A2G3APB6_CAPAN|nr:hypothetical protein T459_03958 [Capsicum annuum]
MNNISFVNPSIDILESYYYHVKGVLIGKNFPRFPLSTIRIQLHCPYPIYASGVWFLHCHFERHLTWGMNTVFIVREGKHREEQLLPRPSDMPPC